MEIQSYVVEALFKRYFKVLRPTKLILNIHKIIRGYSRYVKLIILRVTVKSIEVFSSFNVDI